MERNVKSHEQQPVPVMLVLQPPADDAINLIDLWQVLLRRRWIVFITLVVFLLMSVIYAMLATPVYRAEAYLLPPRISDVEQLQIPLGGDGGMHSVKPKEAYSLFIQNLDSLSLRRRFFDAQVVADQPAPHHDAASLAKAFDGFNKMLSVGRSVNNANRVHVSFDGPDPRRAASWVNAIIAMANKQTVKMLIADAGGILENQRKLLSDSIKSKRALSVQRRKDRLLQLQEAIEIAMKAGIKNPVKNGGAANGNAPLYLLGYSALKAQEQMLLKRKNEDAFIPHLRALQEKLSMLDDIHFDPSKVSAASIDAPAFVPDHRIKPRRTLIVLLGLVIGLAVGLLAAFLAEVFSRVNRPGLA